MKNEIISLLEKAGVPKKIAEENLEVPKSQDFGDFSFPCHPLAKEMKKDPILIAQELARKIEFSNKIEKVEAKGPYLNFFIGSKLLVQELLRKIKMQKDKFGSSKIGRGKKIVIEFSSPNIAKPFGIGHLRSTIIGNSLSTIYDFLGYKVIKINYLGDWGTPFGRVIAGFKHFGNLNSLKKSPINHLYEVYVKASKDEKLEQEARDWFKKMENGDKEALLLWKRFRKISIVNFNSLYKKLGVSFNVTSGESFYEKDIPSVLENLNKKNLLKESEGAMLVDLEKFNLGVSIIQKSDGAKLYSTREIAAAISRAEKYNFSEMIYEVGSEQKLHFSQVFKILELMGYGWAGKCVHISHGLYLDKDGKKFSTRIGKNVFMDEVLNKTQALALKELKKRYSLLQKKDLENRALKISIAAIFYGDLKNYRTHDIVFDINRFISFQGDTGPYLLYTYARAKSILKKANYNANANFKISNLSEKEKQLVKTISTFPDIVNNSHKQKAPNLIANYSFQLAQTFNEFYHTTKVISSKEEQFRLNLVASAAQVLKNALYLLGIPVLEKM